MKMQLKKLFFFSLQLLLRRASVGSTLQEVFRFAFLPFLKKLALHFLSCWSVMCECRHEQVTTEIHGTSSKMKFIYRTGHT